ncbi:MAG: lipid A biosynthesis acyltransferase [Myxococcota bacterium]|nr:lipid A biosynthesis acyltransferase [Myxococcota bacterium]
MRRLGVSLPGPRFAQTYLHLRTFAFVILDRLELWSGAIDRFDIRLHGEQCMRELIERKQGALLVGAHVGSFDVLRLIARKYGIGVNVIMYTGNAELINRAFEELDPSAHLRLIQLDPGASSTALEIRRCISRGEFVAMLGDRVHPVDADRRKVKLDFLGQTAAFSQGPFLMSAILGIPLILTVALRTGFREYDGYLTQISDGVRIPRSARQEAVQSWARQYVELLEVYCKRAPLQWFNFYDFWGRD